METKMNSICTKTSLPNATLVYNRDQRNFDYFMVIVLLFSGWSGEWTWGRQEGFLSLIILYTRLILYPIFFIYYFYFRKRLKGSSSVSASLGIIKLLLILFICVVIGERVENDFVNTWVLWKDYYYLALLPLWAIIGFDIGGDIRRVKMLFYKLALCGAVLSYISFAMKSIGISDKSWIGPMYWPFRFIVIFSFIYFLSVIITGINRKRNAFFWLFGSSLAIFWGFYKFTIVSTVIGIAVWGIFMIIKGGFIRRRIFWISFVLIILLIIGILSINTITGGRLFLVINDIYIDEWIHSVDLSESLNPKVLNQLSANRYKMWEEMLHRVDKDPLLGAGLGQRYEEEIVSHNGYIDLLLSFGKIGTAIFLCAFLVWLIRIIRSRPQNDFLVMQVICVGYIFTILSSNMFGSVWIQFFTINFYTALLSGVSYRLSSK